MIKNHWTVKRPSWDVAKRESPCLLFTARKINKIQGYSEQNMLHQRKVNNLLSKYEVKFMFWSTNGFKRFALIHYLMHIHTKKKIVKKKYRVDFPNCILKRTTACNNKILLFPYRCYRITEYIKLTFLSDRKGI